MVGRTERVFGIRGRRASEQYSTKRHCYRFDATDVARARAHISITLATHLLGGGRGVQGDGGVRPEMGPSIGGRRGAVPPALGPRSGNILRFVTLDGRFVVKNDIADCELLGLFLTIFCK